jgi:hypothetical protein
VLVALREIEKANRNFRKILEDLHDQGNTTGSLGFVSILILAASGMIRAGDD